MSDLLEPDVANCPGMYGSSQCVDSSKAKPEFGMAPVYLSLCSCTASMLGSLLMILPYVMWKDIRSGLRMIVTYLAVADFFTAFGYTIASFNYIHYNYKMRSDYLSACEHFDCVCQIQAYISSWASLSSFWWTAILAFYLYSTITKGETNVLKNWFPFFHVFVWGSPIVVMLPLLVTGSLGYSLFSAGGWCFIASETKINNVQYTDYGLSPITIVKILAGGKAVEIAVYVWVFILYGLIYCNIRRKKKAAALAEGGKSLNFIGLLQRMERKLYAIPIAFVLLRMWGTMQFVFSIGVFRSKHAVDATGCVEHPIYYMYYFLACMQSVGDGGQGWVNAVLYIFFSPKIRNRLFESLMSLFCDCAYEATKILRVQSQRRTSFTSVQYKQNKVSLSADNIS